MKINDLNLNCLKVFEAVYRRQSMTLAAKDLFLTQSGVSQHIKSLESQLNIKLFDRINKQLKPTQKGQKFYRKVSSSLQELDLMLSEICEHKPKIEGTLNIGMPTQFGVDRLIPEIAELSHKYPQVNFNIYMGIASKMIDLLLSGDLHFAFVDDFFKSPKIQSQKVFEEALELCSSQKYYKQHQDTSLTASVEALKGLDFIAYEEGDYVLKSWFRHHTLHRNVSLNIRGRVQNTQALSQLIVNHMGLGVLPYHLIKKLRKNGHKIHIFTNTQKPLINTISVAFIRDRKPEYTCDIIFKKLVFQTQKK